MVFEKTALMINIYTKLMSSSHHMEYKIFIEVNRTNNKHTGMLIMQQMPNTLCFGRKTIKLKNTLTQELLFLLSYFLSVCLFSIARVHSKSSALSQKVVFHVIVYGVI